MIYLLSTDNLLAVQYKGSVGHVSTELATLLLILH